MIGQILITSKEICKVQDLPASRLMTYQDVQILYCFDIIFTSELLLKGLKNEQQ